MSLLIFQVTGNPKLDLKAYQKVWGITFEQERQISVGNVEIQKESYAILQQNWENAERFLHWNSHNEEDICTGRAALQSTGVIFLTIL